MKIYIFFLSVLILVGCHKVKNPFEPVPEIAKCPRPSFNLDELQKRKILIEKFTGHKCPNCPFMSLKVDEAKATNPDKIIYVSIHCVQSFSAPSSSGTGKFESDYRTQTGEEAAVKYSLTGLGLPRAFIGDRKTIRGQFDVANGVAHYKDSSNKILLQSISSINSSDELCIWTHIKSKANISDELFLCSYVVEDSIRDWQKNDGRNPYYPAGDVPNYLHKNVLRASITGKTVGDKVFDNASVNDTTTKSYNFQLKDSWNKDNLSLVSFVYNKQTNEIYNVIKEKLTR